MTNKVEVGIEAKVTANTRDLEQKVTQATRDLSKKTGDLGTAGMSPARSKDTLKAERDALANLLRASRQAAQQGKADLVKIFGDGLSRAQVDALHSASSRLAGRDSLYRQIGGIGGIASGSSRGFFRTGA